MNGADSPVNLENQACNGFPWQDVPKDELRDDIITRLLHNSREN